MTSDIERAWAAGFFDGEGNISFQGNAKQLSGTPHGRLTVQITQHYSPEALERFQAAVGGIGRIYGPYHHKDGRGGEKSVYWKYVASHRGAFEAIAVIFPFLCSVKADQAHDALWKAEACRRTLPQGRHFVIR